MSEHRPRVGLIVLAVLAASVCLLRLLMYRGPGTGLELAWPDAAVAPFRWTPLAVGVIVGAALAVSGLLFQTLLRNPLASPYILGVSSGAALGVIVMMYVGHVLGRAAPHAGERGAAALVGAVAVLAVVYVLGQRGGWPDPVRLILVGVIVSTICGALIMLFHHLVPHGLRNDLIEWLKGNVPQTTGGAALATAGGLTLAGVVAATFMGRHLDAAVLGDDEARSIGLSIGWLRLASFGLAGVLAAGAVTLAGPIGFVGLVAPHAARIILGPRHTPLVIGAALCGIVLIVGADGARQVITVGTRIPVGVLTALVGGPLFLWLLLSRRGAGAGGGGW